MINLGYISGVYGVQGWVKIFSYTSPKENILNYTEWLIDDQPVKLIDGRKQGKSIVVKLEHCSDRNVAINLVSAKISIKKLPILDNEYEFYWRDLISLTVINQEGIKLGTVKELLETGANDVLVVQGENEYLIPFIIKQTVLEINLDKHEIHVDWNADFS
jgi:16S rRNA processing protein RimM